MPCGADVPMLTQAHEVVSHWKLSQQFIAVGAVPCGADVPILTHAHEVESH